MHSRAAPSINRFLDGNLIRTSPIKSIRREGMFWVVGTRVVCNPRGYPGEDDTGLNPELIIDL